MASRTDIANLIATNLASRKLQSDGRRGIIASDHREVLTTIMSAVALKKVITISGLTYQDDDFIGASAVELIGNGLMDVSYTFNSTTGTITFPFTVTATVTAIY